MELKYVETSSLESLMVKKINKFVDLLLIPHSSHLELTNTFQTNRVQTLIQLLVILSMIMISKLSLFLRIFVMHALLKTMLTNCVINVARKCQDKQKSGRVLHLYQTIIDKYCVQKLNYILKNQIKKTKELDRHKYLNIYKMIIKISCL